MLIKKKYLHIDEEKTNTQSKKYYSHPNYSVKVIFLIVGIYLVMIIALLYLPFKKNEQLQAIKVEHEINRILDKQSGQNSILINQTVFCIINVWVNSEKNLLGQFQSIIRQNYKIWKVIFYLNPILSLKIKLNNPNVKIIDSLGNKGKNIYSTIVNECEEQSIIITLKDGQILPNQFVLSQIQKQLAKGYYALISPYEYQGKQVLPNPQIFNFERDKYFPLYQNRSDLSLVNDIISHVRVFKASMYLKIPFVELMYQNQTFFETQFSFILPILEFNAQHYLKTSIIKQRLFPSSVILYRTKIARQLSKNADFINEINEIGQKTKFPTYETIMTNMNQEYKLYREPNFWKQSKGYNVLKRNISKQVNLIPPKTHQIWIGQQIIPDFKKKFISRFSQIMPQFEYRLWLSKDLTQQNFPITYQYILKLKQIDKKSEYSKMSMITNLMRLEIIYHHGGFYYDTNYEPFLSLNHLRHFPFIGVLQMSAYLGEYMANSFFAAQKNSIYLKRLLSEEKLNQINYESHDSNLVSGPRYVATAFQLQDLYYKVKILTPQRFCPYKYWDIDERVKKSRCTFNKLQQIPKQLEGTYKQVLHAKNYYEIFPCDKQYLRCYGIDHWHLGGSWKVKKTELIKN